MKKYYRLLCQCICLGGLSSVGCIAQADQIVSLATTTPFVAAGDTVNVSAHYQVSAPETATEAGIGLRVHFNSALLNPDSVSLYPEAIQPYGPLTADTDDFDNDPLTDRYFVIGWIDFTAQWPGEGLLPLSLLDLQFTVNNTPDTLTRINFSATATAKNTGFQSAPLQLCRKPVLTIAANTPIINEDGTHAATAGFTVSSDQQIPGGCDDLVITYTVAGSATAGDDYTPLPQSTTVAAGQRSTLLPVEIIDDDRVENNETLIISLKNSQDYSLASNASATITITSEDVVSALPEVNLIVDKTTVTEGQGGSLLLYVNRKTNDLSQPLKVVIELGGTATAGNDFHAFSGSITIPAGKTRAHTVLVLKDDADQEIDETLNISIAASASYQRGENSNLQLIIKDDEFNQNTNLSVNAGQNTATAAGTSAQKTHQVPGSSQWMLILMGLLLSGFATRQLRAKAKQEDTL